MKFGELRISVLIRVRLEHVCFPALLTNFKIICSGLSEHRDRCSIKLYSTVFYTIIPFYSMAPSPLQL